MLFRVKAFKLVYVMHKPFVKSRRMKTPFAFLLFIANLYERRNPLHAQPDLVVYSLRLSPVWLYPLISPALRPDKFSSQSFIHLPLVYVYTVKKDPLVLLPYLSSLLYVCSCLRNTFKGRA